MASMFLWQYHVCMVSKQQSNCQTMFGCDVNKKDCVQYVITMCLHANFHTGIISFLLAIHVKENQESKIVKSLLHVCLYGNWVVYMYFSPLYVYQDQGCLRLFQVSRGVAMLQRLICIFKFIYIDVNSLKTRKH